MTIQKQMRRSGRRPSVDECLEAWWRVTDSPPGRLLPDTPGKSGEHVRLCAPFDLYCWRLVCDALGKCKSRNIPPTKLADLLEHRQKGGEVSSFNVYEVIQLDPQDGSGFRSTPRPISDVERLGLAEGDLARSAFVKFRRVLQSVIDASEGHIASAKGA